MKRHINIPVFIPHLGCPNQCVFCNQRTISGVKEFNPDDLPRIIETALSTKGEDTEAEIAFFGGSFTGIDPKLMERLLSIAYEYVRDGRVSSVRCSTRPDYINEDILSILKKYGVKVIELGLQSSDDAVLLISKRGHAFFDEARAAKLIVDSGFSLVGQMMIGLPGSTPETEMRTAHFIIDSGAVGARIYPTVVFRDTELEKMTECGLYTPITLDDAVERSAAVLEMFISAGVEVIRIGLHASENLSSENTYFGGPNHSALGELVMNRLYYNRIYSRAKEIGLDTGTSLTVKVSRGSLSKAIGQKQNNKIKLIQNLGIRDVRFAESDEVVGYEILLENEEKKCI